MNFNYQYQNNVNFVSTFLGYAINSIEEWFAQQINYESTQKVNNSEENKSTNHIVMAVVPPLSPSSSEKSVKRNMHKEQYLFLLEFFVHSITGERLAKLNQMFSVPTCVYLRFLNLDDNDAVEITPIDPTCSPLSGEVSRNNTENFYSGRSVLFAIPHRIVIDKNAELKINIEVYKKMPDGIRPDVMVGAGLLDITQEFAALRKEMFNCWHRDVPPPKCFEGPVHLYHQDNLAAVASIFARISGFGQSIVTEFEAPSDRLTSSSFVFKGDERDNKTVAYKCKIVSQSRMEVCEDSLVTKNQSIKPSMSPNYLPSNEINSNAKIIVRNDQGDHKMFDNTANVEMIENVRKDRGEFNKPCGSPVVLKVSGLLLDENGNMRTPTVTVGGESESADDHDIFVLRIGKKGIVGEGEKSDIQLEMRTPKGPIKRPPIRYETREIQTDIEVESDTTVHEVKSHGKGKKKKKKGKNKKKKKKKKK